MDLCYNLLKNVLKLISLIFCETKHTFIDHKLFEYKYVPDTVDLSPSEKSHCMNDYGTTCSV